MKDLLGFDRLITPSILVFFLLDFQRADYYKRRLDAVQWPCRSRHRCVGVGPH